MMKDYNIHLIIVSIIIAIVASYSALSIASKITNTFKKSKLFWLIAGSVVMGAGVWSMHFVGMIAHHSYATLRYDITITIISMLTSIISSYITFYLTLSKKSKWHHIFIGGIIMGGGIVMMHYLGIEAMIIKGRTTYDPLLVVLSIVIALLASYASLFLFVQFRNKQGTCWLKCLSALIMGVAISGMHYTGMSAVTIEFGNTQPHTSDKINTFLIVGVITAISTIIIILWMTILFDRYVLEKMAYKDHITGLANRNEMTRFFKEVNSNKRLSLLYIDLDQFKAVNDTFGHEMGDLLLEKIGQLLKKFENQVSRAFRIGGDEFLFVLDHSDLNNAKVLAKLLLAQLKQPFCIDRIELYITGSIGIAIGSVKHGEHEKLLRAADHAMYLAKRSGGNEYCIYTEEMGAKEVQKMRLEQDFQRAIDERQFHLLYQPKWNVKMNRLFGFEALARWQHPELGTITPSEFIPIAEESGLIVSFTIWTLEEACKHCKALQKQGIYHPISVNLSPKLFQTSRLYELIDNVLEKFDLGPDYLNIEITESMILHNVDDIIKQLNKVETLGVNVCIDNFGTGYSSIGLLEALPIHAVKLDRIFTRDIDKPSKKAIIQSIIILADSLGLDVIAEGIELEEEINHLTKLGCYIMQGYYYSKPMEFRKIKSWVMQKQSVQLLPVNKAYP